jgi:hypothetical protein
MDKQFINRFIAPPAGISGGTSIVSRWSAGISMVRSMVIVYLRVFNHSAKKGLGEDRGKKMKPDTKFLTLPRALFSARLTAKPQAGL